jgi:hypothetical protein
VVAIAHFCQNPQPVYSHSLKRIRGGAWLIHTSPYALHRTSQLAGNLFHLCHAFNGTGTADDHHVIATNGNLLGQGNDTPMLGMSFTD